MGNESPRWNQWMGRARTCFRAASAIDHSAEMVSSTARELEVAGEPTAQAALEALRQAEAALARARDAVHSALKARKLSAANREPTYSLVG